VSFVVLVAAAWGGTLIIWWTDAVLATGAAFALLGAISTLWLLAETSFGQVVHPQQRGLALGITETMSFGTIALASWLAGQLYERTPTHDLPLIVGAIAIPLVLIAWLALPLGRAAQGDAVAAGQA
jgi:hypothetical protein